MVDAQALINSAKSGSGSRRVAKSGRLEKPDVRPVFVCGLQFSVDTES